MLEQLLNPTLWVPILVVIITWYLGTLSAKRNYDENKRQVIACLISKLTLVYSQLYNIELCQYMFDDHEGFDSLLDSQAKEKLRQSTLGSNLLSDEGMISELRASVNAYSRFRPIHALKITKSIDGLVSYKNQKPKESIENEYFYNLIRDRNKQQVASIRLAILKDVKRLSFSHSFFSYIEMKLYLYRFNKKIVNNANDKLALLKDSATLVQDNHNKQFKSDS
ncbi:TPA: hypothetical protein ACPJ2X_004668 [Vibrio diabolicus]